MLNIIKMCFFFFNLVQCFFPGFGISYASFLVSITCFSFLFFFVIPGLHFLLRNLVSLYFLCQILSLIKWLVKELVANAPL